MSFLWMWFAGYAVPGVLAGSLIKLLPRKARGINKRNFLLMHIALLVSTLISQYFISSLGLSFPWSITLWSILIYLASLCFASALLGPAGIGYGLSALLQQLTLLSAAFLLLPHYSIYLVSLLIVPIFVFCHTFGDRYQYLRIFLLTAWGVISIALFSIGVELCAIVALHTCLGAVLTTRGIIYPELQLNKKK